MCACRDWCEGISDTTALSIVGKGTAALAGKGTAVAGKRFVRSTLQSCYLNDWTPCNTTYSSEGQPMDWRNILPPSSDSERKLSKKSAWSKKQAPSRASMWKNTELYRIRGILQSNLSVPTSCLWEQSAPIGDKRRVTRLGPEKGC
jgi:hypothetical protein